MTSRYFTRSRSRSLSPAAEPAEPNNNDEEATEVMSPMPTPSPPASDTNQARDHSDAARILAQLANDSLLVRSVPELPRFSGSEFAHFGAPSRSRVTTTNDNDNGDGEYDVADSPSPSKSEDGEAEGDDDTAPETYEQRVKRTRPRPSAALFMPSPTEDQIQIYVVECLKALDVQYFAPLNEVGEGKKGWYYKKKGRVAGAPDLIVLEARGGYHGLLLELKTAVGSLSVPQRTFLERSKADGYYCDVAYGHKQALAIVDWYMQLPRTMAAIGKLPAVARRKRNFDEPADARKRARATLAGFTNGDKAKENAN